MCFWWFMLEVVKCIAFKCYKHFKSVLLVHQKWVLENKHKLFYFDIGAPTHYLCCLGLKICFISCGNDSSGITRASINFWTSQRSPTNDETYLSSKVAIWCRRILLGVRINFYFSYLNFLWLDFYCLITMLGTSWAKHKRGREQNLHR